MNITKYLFLFLLGGMMIFSSCFKDLDTTPLDDTIVLTDEVFSDPDVYKQFLAKLYAGLSLTGQQGPDGQADIASIDEGFSQYVRMYWYLSVLTTDEAVIGWNDQTIKDLHNHKWVSTDVFVNAFYRRIFFQVALANEFLRETTTDKLNARGVSEEVKAEVAIYRQEVRFLRAMAYYHAIDLYGNVPFVTEQDAAGAIPKQATRAELFSFLESELLDIENKLLPTNQYGRATQAAAWMLLSKLYLNAEVFTGSPKWSESLKYSAKVIDNGGYMLDNTFEHTFLADNHKSTEIIFPVIFDGNVSRTWGGTTFIIHAGIGGSMNPSDFGVDGGWAGTRTTRPVVERFQSGDIRGNFYTNGQNIDINDVSVFEDGYAVIKFKNIDREGNPGKNLAWTDTDFPMFRLSDAYLMYAEAVVRGGSGGDIATAVGYINLLRQRAFGSTDGNITAADLTLPFILDERGRELLWEGSRRNDLIRFGQFTGGSYLWPWKGGSKEGEPIPAHLSLFPIPSSDLAANPSLNQNPGY